MTVDKANIKPMFTIKEVCKLLSISRWTVYRMIDSGKLKATQVGLRQRKQYRFDSDTINQLIGEV